MQIYQTFARDSTNRPHFIRSTDKTIPSRPQFASLLSPDLFFPLQKQSLQRRERGALALSPSLPYEVVAVLNHMYMSDVTRDKVNQSPEYKLNPATLMSFGADHNLHQPPISYDLYFSSVMIFCVFSGEVVSQTFAIDGRQHIEKQDMQAAYQLSYYYYYYYYYHMQ